MEINHSSKVDDYQHGAQAFQQFMEEAWMFMEDLSNSNMGEEDSKMIREQFLEGWKRTHSVSQDQVQAETVENDSNIQRPQRAEENLTMKSVISHQEDDQKISKEQLVSFLCKAVDKGVVVLKDEDATIQCLQEVINGRSAGVTHKDNVISRVFDERDEAVQDEGRVSGALEGECSSKERENVLGPLDNSSLDNNQVMVSKAATSPRQREVCPSSGSQCMLPSSHVIYQKEKNDHVKDMDHVNQVEVSKAPVSRQGEQCPINGSPCFCTHVNHHKKCPLSTFPADSSTAEGNNVHFVHFLKLFPEFLNQLTQGMTSHVYQQLPKEVSSSFSGMTLQNEKISNSDVLKIAKDRERENSSSHPSLPKVLPSPSALYLPNNGQTQKNAQAPSSYADIVSANRHAEKSVNACLQAADLEEEGGSLVKVPSETLNKRLEFCKFSAIGRVILGKGEEIWHTKKLHQRLNEVWGFTSLWRLISLGKGYFHLLFSSQDELDKVWKRGVISLKPGVLRIQKFTFGVDPTKEKTTHAQVWFRFLHLPWYLWDSSILSALARKIGTPIRFDDNTVNGDYGHYARILIEVDLSKNLKSDLHLDCGNSIFNIKVMPENVPQFCKGCFNIGHSSLECRMLKKRGDSSHPQNKNGTSRVEPNGSEAETDQKDNNKDTCGNHVENGISRQAVLAIENRMEIHRNQRKGRCDSNFQHSEGLDDSLKRNYNDKGFEEVAPDDEIQQLSGPWIRGSKGVKTSNKFEALQEEHENEIGNDIKDTQISDMDERKDEAKRQTIPLSNEEVDHTLKGIRKWAEQAKRNIMQKKEEKEIARKQEDGQIPRISKRWSDMIEEEEEKETSEDNSTSFAHNRNDLLCFERNGELAEIQVSTGKIRFSPISTKKKGM